MSYRTYLYCGNQDDNLDDMNYTQILGNNEYYSEWFDEMVHQGMTTDKFLEEHEGCYGGYYDDEKDEYVDGALEIKDIMGFVTALEKVVMRMEKKRIEVDKNFPEETKRKSFFDFSNIYEKILKNQQGPKELRGYTTLTDEMFEIIDNGYVFMPVALLQFCLDNDCLERIPMPERPLEYKHRMRCYRTKKGKKVCISAG